MALIRNCDHIRLTRASILICIVVASSDWYRVLKRIMTANLFIYGKQVIILEYLREQDGYTQMFCLKIWCSVDFLFVLKRNDVVFTWIMRSKWRPYYRITLPLLEDLSSCTLCSGLYVLRAMYSSQRGRLWYDFYLESFSFKAMHVYNSSSKRTWLFSYESQFYEAFVP